MCRDNQAAFFAFDPKYTMAFIDKNIARIKSAEDLPDLRQEKKMFHCCPSSLTKFQPMSWFWAVCSKIPFNALIGTTKTSKK